MRMLIDECLPKRLKRWMLAAQPTWEIHTVKEAGWDSMKNGKLLRSANGLYDALVTADKNMRYQQNFVGLDIAVVIFPTNHAKSVEAGVSALSQSLLKLERGKRIVVSLSPIPNTWEYAELIEIVQEGDIIQHVFK